MGRLSTIAGVVTVLLKQQSKQGRDRERERDNFLQFLRWSVTIFNDEETEKGTEKKDNTKIILF